MSDGPKDSGNVCCGQMSLCFSLFLGRTDTVLCVKDERDQPDFYQRKVQKPTSVMVWECTRNHSMGDLHICDGTIDTEAYIFFF